MPSSGQDIQTYDGGPGYKHWATEVTLEKILELLKKQGIDPKVLADLHKSLDALNDNGKVDTESLRGVLDNLKAESEKTKARDKTAEESQKKQEGFWAKSNTLGKQAARAFKDANIKDHLKGAGDMFLMPIETMSDAFVKVAGVVGAFGAGLSNAVTAVIDKLKIFGGKLGTVLKSAMGIVGWIAGGLTTVIGGLLGIIDQLGDSFFNMYDTGINFAKGVEEGRSGLGAMAKAAADARLTIGEFAEFVTENSRVAVAIGAEALGALSNSVRTALYPLGNLGLTAAETNEHLGEYLEMQRTMGVLSAMSDSQRARANVNYLQQITLLAQITGKRRKQIAQEMKQAMEQTSLNAWMFTLSAEERAKAMENTQAVTGVLASIDPAAGEAFSEALGKGGYALTDWGKHMMQAGYHQEIAALDALRLQVERGEIDAEQAQKETLRIMTMMRENESAAKATRELSRSGHEAATTATNFRMGLEGADTAIENLSNKLTGAELAIGSWDEMQRGVSQTWTNFIAGLFKNKDFDEGLGQVMLEFQKLLKPDGEFATTLAAFAKEIGPTLVEGIKGLKDSLPDVLNWLKELPGTLKSFITSIKGGIDYIRNIFFDQEYDEFGDSTWVAKDMGKVMDEMWGKITDKLIEGAKNLPWLEIGAAIAAIFLAPKVISSFGGMISSGIGKLFGMGGGGGGAAGATGGVPVKGAESTMGGKLGKNVGGFVGGIGEGVLKGAAAGLAAFGGASSAKIIAGATTLGLAIAAIATGIAGAQWILSKTMGPFAESLKGFEELDGDALRKAGWGMSALGIGLTAMGAGGVIGAVGNLIGGGFEALGELVGVKGPLQRLKEFSEAGKDIDAESVKNTAEAMAAFSKAMAIGGVGTAASGIGTLVGGITEGLGKLFGGTDPLTQLKTFGATEINSAGVKANAEAMSAFAKAMGDAPEIKGERSGGLFGFIAGTFAGGVKMPWDQVKAFAEADLGDSEKLKKNAEGMSAFGKAMSSMPENIQEGAISAIFKSVFKVFGGETENPWDKVKKFGDTKINVQGVKDNASALKAFAEALKDFPDIQIDKIGGMLEKFTSWFTGKATYPWDILRIFGEAQIPLAGVTANAASLHEFSQAIAALPTGMVEKMEAIGKGLQAMQKSVRSGSVSGTSAFSGRGRSARNASSTTPEASGSAWVSTAEEIENLSVNADILTSANNREQLLGDIKLILDEVKTTANKTREESKQFHRKLITATKNNSEFVDS